MDTHAVFLGGVDPGGGEEQDRQVTGTPGDEPEHVPAGGIDPLQVVGEQQERLPVGRVGQ
ncbi:hypothetical protein [Streptomyces sp. AC627_RSS907]|uniref:hypothetical protein n=1 Tax=Streptomyces sp. AC627_RSS907 TaxID=2823684 RepID=UPI0027E5B786|nr:hypothetical protein [Streptomyces sp. AC627_RSS907]